MQATRRVTVQLTEEECDALRVMANAELRDPREQARYLLRQALGIDGGRPLNQQNANHAEEGSEATPSVTAP